MAKQSKLLKSKKNKKEKESTGAVSTPAKRRSDRQRKKQNGRNTNTNNNNNNFNRNDYHLRDAVEGDGSRTIIDMEADGNCLFRSLSDQLYHDSGRLYHVDVRQQVCDYLADHEDDFGVFLVLDDEDACDEEDACDFETYVHTMRQDGDWGGHLELVAAARLYQRNIRVFSADLDDLEVPHGGEEPAGPDLLLSYHENEHYNSVRLTKGTNGPPLPPPTTDYHPTPGSTPERPTNHPPPEPKVATPTTTHAAPIFAPRKNAICPCRSGLRYKKCCGDKKQVAAAAKRARQEAPIHAPDVDGEFRVLHI